MGYRYFNVTADVGVEAYGATLEELFENAALAMFEVMCRTEKVRPKTEKKVEVSADELEGLLREWLTQLLGLKDIYGMMFGQFRVKIDQDNLTLRGSAWGEETGEHHEVKTEVKAVTYHMMQINRNHRWQARFVLDV
jgi:SHS2 domain-containing protein